MSTIPSRSPATPQSAVRSSEVPGRRSWLRGVGRVGPCLTGLILASAVAAAGQVPPDSQAAQGDAATQVESVAEALLRGISEGNPQLLDEALHPDAYLMAVPDQGTARRQQRADFIQNVGDSGGRYLERMWEPRTEVSGPVATVWAPYDFHIDGQFSHCGIDAFQLIRQDDRWMILSVVYTMRRGDDCEPSPLGPPGV